MSCTLLFNRRCALRSCGASVGRMQPVQTRPRHLEARVSWLLASLGGAACGGEDRECLESNE